MLSAAAASRICSTDSRTSTEPGVRARPAVGTASSAAPSSTARRAWHAAGAASAGASHAPVRIASAPRGPRGAAAAQRAPVAAGDRAFGGSNSAMERSTSRTSMGVLRAPRGRAELEVEISEQNTVDRSGDQVIRENPANRGTETSAEVLVGASDLLVPPGAPTGFLSSLLSSVALRPETQMCSQSARTPSSPKKCTKSARTLPPTHAVCSS